MVYLNEAYTKHSTACTYYAMSRVKDEKRTNIVWDFPVNNIDVRSTN